MDMVCEVYNAILVMPHKTCYVDLASKYEMYWYKSVYSSNGNSKFIISFKECDTEIAFSFSEYPVLVVSHESTL